MVAFYHAFLRFFMDLLLVSSVSPRALVLMHTKFNCLLERPGQKPPGQRKKYVDNLTMVLIKNDVISSHYLARKSLTTGANKVLPLAGGMALWLRALSSLTKDPGLISSTHRATQVHLLPSFRGSDTLFWSPWAFSVCGTQTYIQAKHSYT